MKNVLKNVKVTYFFFKNECGPFFFWTISYKNIPELFYNLGYISLQQKSVKKKKKKHASSIKQLLFSVVIIVVYLLVAKLNH